MSGTVTTSLLGSGWEGPAREAADQGRAAQPTGVMTECPKCEELLPRPLSLQSQAEGEGEVI